MDGTGGEGEGEKEEEATTTRNCYEYNVDEVLEYRFKVTMEELGSRDTCGAPAGS